MRKKCLIYAASGYGLKVAYHLSREFEVLALVDRLASYNGVWGGV